MTERIAKITQEKFDASKLHESHHMAAQYNMVDDGSGKTEVNLFPSKIPMWGQLGGLGVLPAPL